MPGVQSSPSSESLLIVTVRHIQMYSDHRVVPRRMVPGCVGGNPGLSTSEVYAYGHGRRSRGYDGTLNELLPSYM